MNICSISKKREQQGIIYENIYTMMGNLYVCLLDVYVFVCICCHNEVDRVQSAWLYIRAPYRFDLFFFLNN